MEKYIIGFHSINAILDKNPSDIIRVFIDNKRKDKRILELIDKLKANNIIIEKTDHAKLQQLSENHNNQGVVALVNNQNMQNAGININTLLENLSNKNNCLIMVLDGITDPHNLGAIIRTCDCFGVDAVIIPKDNSASVNSTVDKVSAGATNHIPVVIVNNLANTIEKLQKAGCWVAGTTLAPQSISLYDFTPTNKMVWVMGNEATGLRRLIAENCDYLVSIPMLGQTQSLNVSVASGVVLSYHQYKLIK